VRSRNSLLRAPTVWGDLMVSPAPDSTLWASRRGVRLARGWRARNQRVTEATPFTLSQTGPRTPREIRLDERPPGSARTRSSGEDALEAAALQGFLDRLAEDWQPRV